MARTRSRRRSRFIFGGFVASAAVIAAFDFPATSLLAQQHQISDLSSRLDHLNAVNKVMSKEVAELQNPAYARSYATNSLGLSPGTSSQAGSGGSGTAGSATPQPVLSGMPDGAPIRPESLSSPPVVPGSSASQNSIGIPGGQRGARAGTVSGGGSGSGRGTSRRGGGARANGGNGKSSSGGGFFRRILRDLEFWR